MVSINNTTSTIDLLLSRRSMVAVKMISPGPTEEELDTIIRAGLRVPDHGRAEPWRIQIITSMGRKILADLQAEIFRAERTDEPEKKLELLTLSTLHSPTMLVVTSHPVPEKFTKVPLIEQQLSGGALCQNILIAAHAMGYVAQWVTGWPAYHSGIKQLLGHSDDVDILGFIHIGSAHEQPLERARPDSRRIVSCWPE